MGKRQVIVKRSVAESIAEVSWFKESKGLAATAQKFSDKVYDFLEQLSDDTKSYKKCAEEVRSALGWKCVQFSRKYTVAFIEAQTEIIVCEFIPSKLIWW